MCGNTEIAGQNYCIYHDDDYWRFNSTQYASEFDHLMKSVGSSGIYEFVGYHIPKFNPKVLTQSRPLYFDHAKFHESVNFRGHNFQGYTSFYKAEFDEEADFTNAVFQGNSNFIETTFKKKVYFLEAVFHIDCSFYGVIFKDESSFWNTIFKKESFFSSAEFRKKADFKGTAFDGKSNFSNAVIKKADFLNVVFSDEVDFFYTEFPNFKMQKTEETKKEKIEIPIRFNYSTFKKRVRFAGRAKSKINLESVSFLGVDLSTFEFHNESWQKASFPTRRNMIIDEKLLEENSNYDEVAKVYNQLRKNFENKLLFNDASDFFLGELESTRKSLVNGSFREKFLSVPYSLYKIFSLYGESAAIPLLYVTPLLVFGLALVRECFGICSIEENCQFSDRLMDSFTANFLLPRGEHFIDISQRVISVPILGMGFIALKRKFERKK